MSDDPGLSALGGLNMNDLLAQAMEMQSKVMAAQEAAARQVHEGVAGGGVVRVEVSGTNEVLAFHIDPKVVDPSDVGMLEDLLLAAVHDASSKVVAQQQQSMGGLGLGSLGGLLG